MNKMKSVSIPLVSIIVPVYNVEQYLKQCIDSLLCQTLERIEIILVDDASTDNSGIICDEYELIDKRIRVIHHKENMGLSCARNDGIDKSTSPFIMFVDGDDSVESQFSEIPYHIAKDNNADLVLFSYKRLFTDGNEELIKTGLKSGHIDEAQALTFNVTIWDAAWIGLYRRELFDEVRYPVGKLYEDTGTSHRLVHVAHNIFFVNEHLYNYRVGRVGSITTDPSTKNHRDRMEMRVRRIKDLYSWGGYEGLVIKEALVLLIKYGCYIDEYEFINKLVNSVKIRDMENLGWKQRAILVVFRISPLLFDCICILTGRRIRWNGTRIM